MPHKALRDTYTLANKLWQGFFEKDSITINLSFEIHYRLTKKPKDLFNHENLLCNHSSPFHKIKPRAKCYCNGGMIVTKGNCSLKHQCFKK